MNAPDPHRIYPERDDHTTSPYLAAAVALIVCFVGGCGVGSLIGWLARSVWR